MGDYKVSTPLKDLLAEVLDAVYVHGERENGVRGSRFRVCESGEMTINDAADAILALVRDVVKGAMPERRVGINEETGKKDNDFLNSDDEGFNAALDQIEASLKQAGVL